MLKTFTENLGRIRARSPLVQNITNYVVMNPTANALLSIGASPIMAHEQQELDDLLGIVQALVLNIGTLDMDWEDSMREAGGIARDKGVPTVLDPVGAGASALRTRVSSELLHGARPCVVRGNASEIMALAGADAATKGVDSTAGSDAAEDWARRLASNNGLVVSVSGAVDYVTDGEREARVYGGHSMMPLVTGMGCTATALTGAFVAVADDPFDAARDAMVAMAAAGMRAGKDAKGPGSFQWRFLDELYTLDPVDARERVRID